uniref:Uncharacterized protein n=1 Tax=Ditylum brightwellii TaxID=49249 RepID=A0A6V2HVD1_9STRA
MAANNERKDPPDLLSGSLEFARSSMTSSMRFLGETVGYIDSDDEDETEAGNEEENKLTGTPEDTLKLPEAAKHRRALLAKKKILKEERKGKTAAGAAAGAVIGAIVVFPVFPLGLVLGGAAGATITNKVAKHKDKKRLKKLDRRLLAKEEKQLKVDQTTLS